MPRSYADRSSLRADPFAPMLKFHTGLLGAALALTAPVLIGMPNTAEADGLRAVYSCFLSMAAIVIILGTATALTLQILRARESYVRTARYDAATAVGAVLAAIPSLAGLGMAYTAIFQDTCACRLIGLG